MISNDRLEQALRYRAQTDNQAAEAKAKIEECTAACKRASALAFLESSGTVKERECRAQLSKAVEAAEDSKVDAVLSYEKLKNKRETEDRVIEVWRSLNASRRTGNI